MTYYGRALRGGRTGLDPYGIAISTATGVQEKPAVAFGADNYFVVWKDDRSGSSDIYGPIAADGSVLDGSGIAVSTAAEARVIPPSPLVTASTLLPGLIPGTDRNTSGDRGSPWTGPVLDPEGIAISTASGAQTYPAVAYDGANFLVVWQDARGADLDIYGARVTPPGRCAGLVGHSDLGRLRRPELSGRGLGGASYLVDWEDDRSGTNGDIYAARVSPAGAVLGRRRNPGVRTGRRPEQCRGELGRRQVACCVERSSRRQRLERLCGSRGLRRDGP